MNKKKIESIPGLPRDRAYTPEEILAYIKATAEKILADNDGVWPDDIFDFRPNEFKKKK